MIKLIFSAEIESRSQIKLMDSGSQGFQPSKSILPGRAIGGPNISLLQ